MLNYVGIVFIALITSGILKALKSSFSIYPILAAGIYLLLNVLPDLYNVYSPFIQYIKDASNGNTDVIALMVKCGSIAVICNITADLCGDFNEKELGTKIEFAGSIILLTIAVPIFSQLLDELFLLINRIQ